jgi:hypothetical protein
LSATKLNVIAQVRDAARDLGALCATNGLVRLETLFWAAEQQAMLEALIDAAEHDVAEPEQRMRAQGR